MNLVPEASIARRQAHDNNSKAVLELRTRVVLGVAQFKCGRTRENRERITSRETEVYCARVHRQRHDWGVKAPARLT